MGLNQLESSICGEVRRILCNQKIRVKDLMKWSTGNLTPADDEVMVFVQHYAVNVCVKQALDKRKATTPAQNGGE
jgi:hypothetical protein